MLTDTWNAFIASNASNVGCMAVLTSLMQAAMILLEKQLIALCEPLKL